MNKTILIALTAKTYQHFFNQADTYGLQQLANDPNITVYVVYCQPKLPTPFLQLEFSYAFLEDETDRAQKILFDFAHSLHLPKHHCYLMEENRHHIRQLAEELGVDIIYGLPRPIWRKGVDALKTFMHKMIIKRSYPSIRPAYPLQAINTVTFIHLEL